MAVLKSYMGSPAPAAKPQGRSGKKKGPIRQKESARLRPTGRFFHPLAGKFRANQAAIGLVAFSTATVIRSAIGAEASSANFTAMSEILRLSSSAFE